MLDARHRVWCSVLRGGGVAILLSLGTVAYADAIQGTVFKVEARTESGSRIGQAIEIPAADLTNDDGLWVWTLPLSITILDQNDNELAVLRDANVSYYSDSSPSSPELYAGMGFSLGSLEQNEKIIFTITSALLATTPAIAHPSGSASAGLTVNDDGGGGATLEGKYAGPTAFIANYNGMVPGGTNFAALVPGVSTPGGSNSASGVYPGSGAYATIGVPVSDISMQFKFSLTAGDSSGGTANFDILPEPAAGLLATLLLLVCRRR